MRCIALVLAVLLGASATPVSADFQAVLTAAREGDTEAVRALLAGGDDPNPPDWEDGYAPLQFAAGDGHVEMVRLLLSAGADTEYRDHNGDRALLWAAEAGHAETVRLLLEAGSPADAGQDPYGLTPLMAAVKRGSADAARLLLAAGADANARDQTAETPLHYAARLDDPTCVELLLAAKATPNAIDEVFYATPLHEAARWASAATIRSLVEAAAPLEARNNDGETPLFVAAVSGNVEALDALLIARADPDRPRPNGETPILAAINPLYEVGSGQAQAAARLAGVTSDLDRAFADALWTGLPDVAMTLLERGAQAAARDDMGRPALAATARYPGLRFFDLLMARGADLSIDGPAALLSAASLGHLELAGALLARGVGVDVRDEAGGTPLLQAVHSGQVEMVELLLAAGADAKATDSQGRGAAVYMDFEPKMLEFVIERRSASRARRPTTEYAAELAKLRANHEAIRKLLDAD